MFGSAPASSSNLTASNWSYSAATCKAVSPYDMFTSTPDCRMALIAGRLPFSAAHNIGFEHSSIGPSIPTALRNCDSIFASNERTPPTLHTKSLYFLLTCARLRVSNRSSLDSISAANTSGSCSAMTSKTVMAPSRRLAIVDCKSPSRVSDSAHRSSALRVASSVSPASCSASRLAIWSRRDWMISLDARASPSVVLERLFVSIVAGYARERVSRRGPLSPPPRKYKHRHALAPKQPR
mmetsp:Transcript_8206/g.37351  ORF Transcript_8206/g.37351 Transcript_8206/m.37351 type:complete len:238 (-) Transcript_8206:3315-4028(-)